VRGGPAAAAPRARSVSPSRRTEPPPRGRHHGSSGSGQWPLRPCAEWSFPVPSPIIGSGWGGGRRAWEETLRGREDANAFPPKAIAQLDKRQLSLYNWFVIRSFRHRGLKRFYESGDPSRISAALRSKIQRVLSALDAARSPQALDIPGYRLHPLKGDLEGFWSVTVSGNWRVIFRFEDGDAFDVDLLDYH
jgi:toxin HigB-1